MIQLVASFETALRFMAQISPVVLIEILALYLLFMVVQTIYNQYSKLRFYQNQGIPFWKNAFPLFGNLREINQITQEPQLFLPQFQISWKNFGQNIPEIAGFQFYSVPYLLITSPQMTQQIYQNKYLEKDIVNLKLTAPLLGKSGLFQQTKHKLWKQQSDAIHKVFKKSNIVALTNDFIQIIDDNLQQWEKNKEINLLDSLDDIQCREMLYYIFGIGVDADLKLPFQECGKIQLQPLGWILNIVLQRLFARQFSFFTWVFPSLMNLSIFEDKDMKFNCNILRNYFRQYIVKYRELNNQDKRTFLWEFLNNDIYQNDDDFIIDECLNIFFAGTQSIKFVNANFLIFCKQNQSVYEKLMQEIQQHILDKGQDLSYENIQDLDYLDKCYQECLRIEPPITLSTDQIFTEDQQIGKYMIQKDTPFIILIQQLHHNPDQWIDSKKFIPERFDPSSPYYLTPSGQRRHPQSFTPFFGGARVCAGKAFAFLIQKLLLASILMKYDYSFKDSSILINKPILNVDIDVEPQILMSIKSKQKFGTIDRDNIQNGIHFIRQ